MGVLIESSPKERPGLPARAHGLVAERRALARELSTGDHPPDAIRGILFRLLADTVTSVWRPAARTLGRLAARDRSTLDRIEEGLSQPVWRPRAIAALAALAGVAPETPVRTPESSAGPVEVGAVVRELLLGQGSMADGAAALDGLTADHPMAIELDPIVEERARFAPPTVRRSAVGFLARCPRADGVIRARFLLEEAGMWRSQTLEDCLEIGRAYPALVRYLIRSTRAAGDGETIRQTIQFLQEMYGRAEQTLQRAILAGLYRWAIDDPAIPVVRGLFDGAGSRQAGDAVGELLESVQGAVLARLYWAALGERCAGHDDWAAYLAESNFLTARGRPTASALDESRADEPGLAFLARLVLAEERAYHRLTQFFRQFDDYRELDPPTQAEVQLALRDLLPERLPVEIAFPATPGGLSSAFRDPFGRFAALRARLEALDLAARCTFLVRASIEARRDRLPRLEETVLDTLVSLIDADPAHRTRGIGHVLPLLSPDVDDDPIQATRLARLVEIHADQIAHAASDPDALFHLVSRLLGTNVPDTFLGRVALLARDRRVGRLFQIYGRLLRDVETVRGDAASLAVSLAAFRDDLAALMGDRPSRIASRTIEQVTGLRQLLRTPLLGGFEAGQLAAPLRTLVALQAEGVVDEAFDARHFGHLLRDLEDEIEAFRTIDFESVRERLATLARVEEKVELLLAAGATLPRLEVRILGAITAKWKGEIDRAERFFLKLKSSVLTGDPADVLGLGAEKTLLIPTDFPSPAEVRKVRDALYRFRVRFLINRYDMDRAYCLIENGPAASCESVMTDRRHGRILALVTALLYLPYLLYWLSPRVVGGLHLSIVACSLFGGAVFLLRAGRHDPAMGLRLILPRLLGAIVTWYFVIGLGQEIWVFTVAMDPIRFSFLVTLTAMASLLYTYAEVSRHDDERRRTRRKALTVFAIGLTQSFAIGTFLTSIMGPTILSDHLDLLAHGGVLGIPAYVEILGMEFFPTIVLAWSFLTLFLGMFLNLIFEDKGMADV